MADDFAGMTNEELEEMKRQLMAEIDDIKEFNEDQLKKQEETEKEKTRVLEEIEKSERDKETLDGNLARILNEMKEKES